MILNTCDYANAFATADVHHISVVAGKETSPLDLGPVFEEASKCSEEEREECELHVFKPQGLLFHPCGGVPFHHL